MLQSNKKRFGRRESHQGTSWKSKCLEVMCKNPTSVKTFIHGTLDVKPNMMISDIKPNIMTLLILDFCKSLPYLKVHNWTVTVTNMKFRNKEEVCENVSVEHYDYLTVWFQCCNFNS